MSINRFPSSPYLTDDDIAETLDIELPDEKIRDTTLVTDRVTSLVYAEDAQKKALTGGTTDTIETTTGISADEMFPKDKKILYIGDPWQSMGKELDESHGSNLTLIDYEFGDAAAFIKDINQFLPKLEKRIDYILDQTQFYTANFETLNPKEQKWITDVNALLKIAISASANAITDDQKLQAANDWQEVTSYINAAYKQQLLDTGVKAGDPGGTSIRPADTVLAPFRKQLWYDSIYAARGYRDTVDWKNIIEPKLKALEAKLKDLTEYEIKMELAKEEKSLINYLRLKKQTKNTNVVQAIFPELPFKSRSFDRVVASWSISAHIFRELDTEGFNVLWEELSRVMSNDAKAYIFPMNFRYSIDDTLMDSLDEMSRNHPEMSFRFVEDRYREKYTLLIEKHRA